jgi:flagellin
MTLIPNLSTQISPDPSAAREALLKSLSRLNAGKNAVSSVTTAAEAPVASARDAQADAIDTTQQQVSGALSFTQTQSAYLKKISEAFDRMGRLAGAAQNTTDSTQLDHYQSEYSQLAASISSVSTNTFNGASLFSGNTIEVALDPQGNTLSLPGVSLNSSVYTDALQANLTSTPGAQDALGKLTLATAQVAQDRTAVEAGQAQLYTAADSLAVSKENLNAATSTIRDVDAAEESAQFARENIVSKAGTAMLAQANAMPQSALRLLP